MRHDEENRLFAALAQEAFRDVEIEPPLTALSGEIFDYKTANVTDEARSDTRVRNFWGNKANAFFDFRVFYPFATSYVDSKISSLYTAFEKTKEREYKQRIREVEDGSSSTGGMGPQMTAALKHLAAKLAEKRNEPYHQTIGLMRVRFAFAMMRSSLICLRGSRNLQKREFYLEDSLVDLVMEDTNLRIET